MFAALFKTAKTSAPWEDFENGTRTWKQLSAKEQEAVTEHYLPKVRYLAQKQKSRVPGHIDYNDLFSAGMLGLLDALGKYRPETGFAFSTYSENRILGAMLDEMRSRDPLSRGTRALVRTLTAASDSFEHKKGRKPTETELAKLTKLSIREVRQGLQAMEQQVTTDMNLLAETLSADAPESGGVPCNQIIRNENVKNIRAMLEKLSERDNFILSMSFLEEYSQREIAEVLGVSEGRVSQLRTQALKRLQALYVANFGK